MQPNAPLASSAANDHIDSEADAMISGGSSLMAASNPISEGPAAALQGISGTEEDWPDCQHGTPESYAVRRKTAAKKAKRAKVANQKTCEKSLCTRKVYEVFCG